jgi:hypothetical protein
MLLYTPVEMSEIYGYLSGGSLFMYFGYSLYNIVFSFLPLEEALRNL